MSVSVKSEWTEMKDYVNRNGSELSVVFLGTLFVLCGKFDLVSTLWLNYLIFYFVLPVLSIVLIFRRNPIYFGFQLGNYKVWGFHLLVACPVIGILIYLNSTTAPVAKYYKPLGFNYTFAIEMAVVLFAWEYICRGFFIFGLRDSMKEGAILVQMMPFVLLHIGKPEVETITCIVSGLYFGYLAYRGNSFWPAFILHYYMTIANQFWVS